jgi:hypothetical protein
MNIENKSPNCGVVLLRDLKALVDSFPEGRRKELIKLVESVFRSLRARRPSEHSDP